MDLVRVPACRIDPGIGPEELTATAIGFTNKFAFEVGASFVPCYCRVCQPQPENLNSLPQPLHADWVLINRVTRTLNKDITIVILLMTLLASTHEPASRVADSS